MKCVSCGSKVHKNGTDKNGNQKWRCPNCKSEKKPIEDDNKPVAVKVGMSMNEFKTKYDTEHIVTTRLSKVMAGLSRTMIYEKADIVKLAGLPASYPGFKDTLDGYDEHQGRTNSRVFYSHPETIAELKRMAKLT